MMSRSFGFVLVHSGSSMFRRVHLGSRVFSGVPRVRRLHSGSRELTAVATKDRSGLLDRT